MSRLNLPLIAVVMGIAMASGCVQYPTERQGAVDLRPQISFHVAPAVPVAGARVYVNGLDAGSLDSMREGVASLRLLPGTHLIQVRTETATVYEERVYVADGAYRTLLINGGGAR